MSRSAPLILLASLALGAQGFAQEATQPAATADSTAQEVDGTAVDPAAEAAANAPATIRDVDDARTTTLVLDEWVNRTLDRTVARTNRPLTISGTVSNRFTFVQGQPATPVYASFSVPSTSLNFKGTLFKDYEEAKNLTYSFGFTSSNGAAPTLADGNIAYAALSSVDLANPTLNITLGQQKKPWGQEAQADAEAQPSITGSTYLSGFGVSDVSARDIGVVIKGDILPTVDYGYNYRAPLLTVSAGFFNGAGANVGTDNNRDKNWVVRGVIAPPVGYYNILRGLTLGASYSKDEKNITGTGGVLTPAKTFWVYKTNASGAKTDSAKYTVVAVNAPNRTIQGDRTRLGVDVSYIRTPVNLTLEGVYATQDSIAWNATTKDFSSIHKQGAGGSATLFLNFGEQFLKGYREQSRPDDWWPITWQPFFRVDGYDPDINVDGQNEGGIGAWQFVGTVGGNIFFARTTKFQLNYRWKKTEGKPANFHETLAQFQYGF